MKMLITGGAGFIGSNFIKYMAAKYPDYHIVHLDALTYAGNLLNLKDIEFHSHYEFIQGDIADASLVTEIFKQGIDYVVNFAAESHVDRSIADPGIFVHTNIVGTQTLLEAARKYGVKKFIQISTDEVYGTLDETGKFTEETPLAPNSPYSASKASADLLVRAYHETYQLPVNITRCSNNYGPYQFPEKLIPLMILQAMADQALPVYGDGLHVRDWIYVEDHCRAIDFVLQRGVNGEVYNIGANCEKTNLEVVQTILRLLNKPESLIRFVDDRPGHDRRYAIDASKMHALGWKPLKNFEEGLASTIEWYANHPEWINAVKTGEYQRYYEKQYGKRLGAER